MKYEQCLRTWIGKPERGVSLCVAPFCPQESASECFCITSKWNVAPAFLWNAPVGPRSCLPLGCWCPGWPWIRMEEKGCPLGNSTCWKRVSAKGEMVSNCCIYLIMTLASPRSITWVSLTLAAGMRWAFHKPPLENFFQCYKRKSMFPSPTALPPHPSTPINLKNKTKTPFLVLCLFHCGRDVCPVSLEEVCVPWGSSNN